MLPILILSIIALSSQAKESIDLEFEEDGKTYKEKIIFDEKSNITIYEVPKHAKLEQASYLIDRNAGVEVIKMTNLKKCFVKKMPIGEPSNKDVKQTFQKTDYKFPLKKYMVENHDFVPVRKLLLSELSNNVKAFCLNYEIYEMKDISIKELEKHVTSLLTRARSKRQNGPISGSIGSPNLDFVFCDKKTYYMLNCVSPLKVKAKCKFQQKSCVFSTICDTSDLAQWKCKGVPRHIFNSLVCCDLVCA